MEECYFYAHFYILYKERDRMSDFNSQTPKDVLCTRYGYGYVRVSTDRQDELSPDSQAKLLQEYASKNNIILLEIFYEIGVSGRKADKRPQFQRMISLAKSTEHPVDVILVWKYSRFARNQEESIVYKSLLKKQHGIDVISISEPLIDGPFGSLIERIIEWMDEYYSIRLSGEVLRGMKEKALRGGYQAAPCLGYRAFGDGKPFLINEDEYKIVSYIFEQYDLYDEDYTKIARQLNGFGYRTRRGKPFESRSVERILTNPFYYGLVIWNGYSFMGEHEVRLTKEQFDERMKKMHSRHSPAKRRAVSACRHWLSGLLKCGFCGSSLAYSGSNIRSPGFQCYKYAKGMHAGSSAISERKAVVGVYEYFEKLLGGMDLKYEYRAPESTGQTSRLFGLQGELAKLDSRELRIRLAFENGVDTLEEYKENKERLHRIREAIQNQIAELNSLSSRERPAKDAVLSRVQTVYDVIKNPDIGYETKGTFMRSLVEEIILDKENHQLIFHLYIS